MQQLGGFDSFDVCLVREKKAGCSRPINKEKALCSVSGNGGGSRRVAYLNGGTTQREVFDLDCGTTQGRVLDLDCSTAQRDVPDLSRRTTQGHVLDLDCRTTQSHSFSNRNGPLPRSAVVLRTAEFLLIQPFHVPRSCRKILCVSLTAHSEVSEVW